MKRYLSNYLDNSSCHLWSTKLVTNKDIIFVLAAEIPHLFIAYFDARELLVMMILCLGTNQLA
jgi:hypothetical protein